MLSHLVYTVLGIEPGTLVLYLLGKQSTNWATSPALTTDFYHQKNSIKSWKDGSEANVFPEDQVRLQTPFSR